MQYELVRSKRRTLAITIDGGGRCVVRAPLRMPLREIEAFVNEKRSWIETKLHEIKIKTAIALPEPQLQDGAEWIIAGKKLHVKFVSGTAKNYVAFKGNTFECSPELSRTALIKFLCAFAKEFFCQRIEKYVAAVGAEPRCVKVSEAHGRWGSCSAQNVLNFSWRLIFAPLPLIDYVVVHELCHIGCMNHSKIFWQRVASVMPDYAIRRKALKEYGYLLKWFR